MKKLFAQSLMILGIATAATVSAHDHGTVGAHDHGYDHEDWHHGWHHYHDRVYVTDPWYEPYGVYAYGGYAYPYYYRGYPYYYYNPQFYYVQPAPQPTGSLNLEVNISN